jgi:hypothetical protein
MRAIMDWIFGIGCSERLAGGLVRRVPRFPEHARSITQRREGAKDRFISFFFAPLRLCVRPVSVSNPQSPIPHPFRRGFTLLEVLVSMGVLMIGLLGVAALIPIGKLAMIETNKSDRTGACGRAGLRDVKSRRMLDSTKWFPNPAGNTFVLDPLGCQRGLNGQQFGGLNRTGLTTISSQTQAEAVFLWHDDLTYTQARDTESPTNGDRPVPEMIGDVQQIDGNFSWFATVTASPAEVQAGLSWGERRQFNVSIVVCWKRLFTNSATDTSAKPEELGEAVVENVKCDADDGYGGIGIEYEDTSSTAMPKENEWVLLATGSSATAKIDQTTWYRVVSAGKDGTTTRATLVGRDWHGGGSDGNAKLVIVKGASGVYTTTVQLDDDGIWSK